MPPRRSRRTHTKQRRGLFSRLLGCLRLAGPNCCFGNPGGSLLLPRSELSGRLDCQHSVVIVKETKSRSVSGITPGLCSIGVRQKVSDGCSSPPVSFDNIDAGQHYLSFRDRLTAAEKNNNRDGWSIEAKRLQPLNRSEERRV